MPTSFISRFSFFGSATAITAVAAFAVLAVGGCEQDRRTGQRSGRTNRLAMSSEKSQSLLQSAANELTNLPEQSIVNLRPPSVILDATKSSDGQDVEAVLTSPPGTTARIYNVLHVPAGNARFKALGVRSGDIVKYYANVQSELAGEFGTGGGTLTVEQMRDIMKLPENQRAEVAEAMRQEGQVEGDIFTTTAVELKVAQVLDADTLMVEEAFRLPIEQPMRMEIIRFRDSRFADLVMELNRYARRGVPRLGWEPSPDLAAIQQIVERLNQWLRQTKAQVEWKPAALLETLPAELRQSEALELYISDEALAREAFSLSSEELRAIQAQAYEGRLLQEATWARGISNWATENEFESVGRANRLFDWTVRNLQLDAPDAARPAYRPWQLMAGGRATAEGRAWVFAQLCRQQLVPVVIVRPDGQSAPWWCGALIDGELYLYDPQLGLPIETSSGQTATLAQVMADPSILSAYDLEDAPYLDAADFQASAEVIAGAFALTRRVALLEDRLSGDNVLMLSVDADELAERLKGMETFESVSLWSHPYEVLHTQLNASRALRTRAALEFEPFVYKPRLWKARQLHFRGEHGSTTDAGRGNIQTHVDDHRDAGQLYTNENVRPPQNVVERQEDENARRAWAAAKQNATYWQGLLSYDRRDFDVALNWLNRSLESDAWQQGARYNRARTHEALGDRDEAVQDLKAAQGPQSRGNRLRARMLSNEPSESAAE